jgi:hypothetical protein
MLVSRNYQLLLVAAFALLLKAYDPVMSPVIGALDPWGWVVQTRQYLAAGQLDLFFAKTGYPPTFLYMIASVASLGIDAYDVIRYLPIVSSLSVIPIYLLMNEIFESRGVAATTALLTVTSRWHFMRGSIGTPEGLSHTLLAFTLYYLLKSLKTDRWIYRAYAAILMTVTILFYHFTLVILAVFIVLLPILVRFGERKRDLKVLGTVVAPAVLLSGVLWYFWVLGPIVQTYFTATFPGYQAPRGVSLYGLVYALGYSIGKLGAVSLSTLGYTMVILAFLGLAGLVVFGRLVKEMKREIRFLVAYLVALGLLAFTLEMTYNVTGMAGTGITRLYVFSYVTMPVAAFASGAIARAPKVLQRFLTQSFEVVRSRRFSKAIPVAITILVCIANMSGINYYKAWSGKGIGFLESHYYVKFLTDEEYYGLAYVRDNAPKNCIVLTVGVEEGILTHHATVSRRTMVSIRDLVDDGRYVLANVTIMYPELVSDQRQGRIGTDGQGASVYFISGVRKVSSELATGNEPPPPKKTMMEQLLVNKFLASKGCEQVYRNNQVSVLRLPSVFIEYVPA